MAATFASIEKLRGRDNYETWKFAAQAYLQMNDLWSHVEGTCKEIDPVKKKSEDSKAKASIILLVDSVNFSHIQKANTAKDVWDSLKVAFEDSGLLRRVALLRELVSTRLVNCGSMEFFVNKIIMTAHKLKGAGMEIDDEWIGTLLLAGLSDEYKPMIMAIESSGTKISADLIKTKLLQEVRLDDRVEGSASASAMYVKPAKSNNYQKKKKQVKDGKCFGCGEVGHYKNKCPKAKMASHSSVFSCLTACNLKSTEWYVDSGASAHMTCEQGWMENLKPVSESGEVTIANQSKLKAELIGNVLLQLQVNNRIVNTTVHDVLFVPGLCTNLLSVSQLVGKGLIVKFSANDCKVFDKNNKLLVEAKVNAGMFKVTQTSETCLRVKVEDSWELWHRRLGHVGHDSLMRLRNGFVDGMVFVGGQQDKCEVCLRGNRLAFRSRTANLGLSEY